LLDTVKYTRGFNSQFRIGAETGTFWQPLKFTNAQYRGNRYLSSSVIISRQTAHMLLTSINPQLLYCCLAPHSFFKHHKIS